MNKEKLVYKFGIGAAEGNSKMIDLLGGKGANLAEMSNIGIAVPPGFTITTEVCKTFYSENNQINDSLKKQVLSSLNEIEQNLERKFGDVSNPLLVSVRSGAKFSMPGMMDTILNLGLNQQTVIGLAQQTNNERFAYDSYRRFIQMYSNIVLKIDHYIFEEIIEWKKQDLQIEEDGDLSANDLKDLVEEFLKKVKDETGFDFPEDPFTQLFDAISAVFESWMSNRAITYRKLNNIDSSYGTAVSIQSMVFGNKGNNSATGVVFTRNPTNGEKEIYGEYLINAQGEDVVAGIRTPQNITLLAKKRHNSSLSCMEEEMPELFNELLTICCKLEFHYKDMQDIEFTIEDGKLWILQTRSGKRTIKSAVKIAVDLVAENIITTKEAITRIDLNYVDQLLHPTIDSQAKFEVIAQGLPASPGAATGRVVFSSEKATELASNCRVILVRTETSPEDIHGMHVSEGILTSRGGMTSHAAVVARGMGKPCICGAKDLFINNEKSFFTVHGYKVNEGDMITISGSSGEVIIGEVPMIQPELSEDFLKIIKWSNEIRRLKVRANAETKHDSEIALSFGAEGIGLCRTEHMFFDRDRINPMREMILAENTEQRVTALEKILPMQTRDFVDIFKVMEKLPVNIRFLDPPLHEFLPHSEEEIKDLAKMLDLPITLVKNRLTSLKEQNPMLGHRGCRLGITYQEIYQMQAEAIFTAMVEIYAISKSLPNVELMIPLIFDVRELDIIKLLISDVARKVELKHSIKLIYEIGTMIELPRAALKAAEIAKSATFFSFGTNDLTQTSLGISRDDSANFINVYQEKNIFKQDPFVTIDQEGVGELIKIAIERGKSTNSKLKLGICGEHGGDQKSIHFFHKIGLDYVSCSPYRVPVAIIAAAQASILNEL